MLRPAHIWIQLKTVNDAFQPEPEMETARILRELADRIERSGIPVPDASFRLVDSNGTITGYCEGSWEQE